MSAILFYRYSCSQDPPPLPSGISSYTAQVWRPSGISVVPACGLSPLTRLAWTGFHLSRIFRNRDHTVVLLHRNGLCVHRTLLFPPYFRFPFMSPDDLQCGDIWTHPSERGHGLATAGLALALYHAWQSNRRFWYLTEEINRASCLLAAKAGFHLVGRGQRRARCGLKILGQFVMTSETQSAR